MKASILNSAIFSSIALTSFCMNASAHAFRSGEYGCIVENATMTVPEDGRAVNWAEAPKLIHLNIEVCDHSTELCNEDDWKVTLTYLLLSKQVSQEYIGSRFYFHSSQGQIYLDHFNTALYKTQIVAPLREGGGVSISSMYAICVPP